MSGVVIDASFAIALLTAEAQSPQADALVQRTALRDATAPLLLSWEFCNGLAMKTRRGLVTAAERDGALADFARILIAWDGDGTLQATVGLAELHHLTVYDAAYLELAVRRGLPLASFDSDLRKAAAAEGLVLAV